ncbi:hypothetical protein OJAV_G00177650 [Oryzias javanicus]|uniref:Uncharacterized protein n=1 Tax=Oryzias javanicus TaxID=123683 RepID=A0A3S2PB49_ORYJA|nr:hypothetical protein OJAV_G00177650 [Oryzias javanicus]
MSATFTEDVQALKELLLHNPVVLKLQGCSSPPSNVRRRRVPAHLHAAEAGAGRGKTLLLGARGPQLPQAQALPGAVRIPASELPVSHHHPFNQGFYDIIIATDEQSLSRRRFLPDQRKGEEEGIVGRTARADDQGTALSFISHTERPLLAELEEALSTDNSESVLKPDQFRMEEIQGFRYRCRDAMRAVTKQAVREARLKEIKQEKLRTYFHDNPRDLQLLRHDKDLHPAVVKPHMKNILECPIPVKSPPSSKSQSLLHASSTLSQLPWFLNRCVRMLSLHPQS